MGKTRPFLEVFASALKEDYGFPTLELVAFAYILATIILATTLSGSSGIGSIYFTEETLTIYALRFIGNPLMALLVTGLFFGLLVLKNIAYSFGNDLERGVIVSLLSYPLKRRSLFTAKLLSSLGVPFMLFVALQFFLVSLLTPGLVSIPIVLATILAANSYSLVVASIVLVLTVRFKRGSRALMVGIVLYFASFFIFMFSLIMAVPAGPIALKVASILFPILPLQLHYQIGWDPIILKVWTPSLSEAFLYIGAAYVLTVSILALACLYFERRLEI